MKSNRPYLIRAIYEWIVDNDCTPHLLVQTHTTNPDGGAETPVADVDVPWDFVQDGRIVLNVSMNATRGLELGDEFVHFNARFGGRSCAVCVPVGAVVGVFARENGEGMAFELETAGGAATETRTTPDDKSSNAAESTAVDAPEDPSPPRPGGPNLRIVS